MSGFLGWLNAVPPWAQRAGTVVLAVGVGALGVFVPATAPFAGPAALGLLGWALPHTADAATLAKATDIIAQLRGGPPKP